MTADYRSIIAIIPGIRSGKPIVRDTRITVEDVLSYLAAGMSHQEIIENFPPLTEEAILASLNYAADHGVPFQS